jgi:hypothetical protein
MASTINQRLGREGRNRAIFIRNRSDLVSTASTIHSLDLRHARLERNVAASVFEIALQVCHERVAVHDTGRQALDDARVCFDVWFAAEGFISADESRWCV